MAETLTYAERVKRQWKYDVAADYCNHREVTIQLVNDSKREEIYRLLKEVKIPIQYIEGIIQKPGNTVNITVDKRNSAIKLADLLRKRPEVKSAIAHGDERIDLTIRWVPIHYPQKHLDEILADYEIHGPVQLGSDKYGIKDGRRIYRVNKETMERNQLPSYLYLGKIRCAVSYNGQIQTCSFCTEQGHKFRDCPKRMRIGNSDADKQDVPMTTTRNVESEEEEPAPPLSERTIKLLREKSTKDTEKSRAGELLEGSLKLDSNEQSPEQQKNRGNKRKDISGDSTENQENQKSKIDHMPYDFTELPLNETADVRCTCRNFYQVRRSNKPGKEAPRIQHPVYCEGCDGALIRCNCVDFSFQLVENRYKPCFFNCCKTTYKPNPSELNRTIT
ncbi:unnamed protein product [Clavelina lepadiformis]|uniref:CCHC-type domain-containing protein n=1 Tax=Clavelina lepadiformis TaxID=159417 RepID=A0ABP0FXG5_CLALP